MTPIRVLSCLLALSPAAALATPYTPAPWQQYVDTHADPTFVGQRKHTTWSGDLNRNFIDDQIEKRFRSGEYVNVVVQLNRCLTPPEIEQLGGGFGTVSHVGQLVSVVLLDNVAIDDLPQLAARREVAMVEWRAPAMPEMDVTTRAIQARSSGVYAGLAAEDVTISGLPLSGTGINIAVVGSGVGDGTAAWTSLPASKFVAGFDATNPNDPGNGTTNPPQGPINHESVMASIALGVRNANGGCRVPTDGMQLPMECGGVAPGAGLVDVNMCSGTATSLTCQAHRAYDWIGTHARQFNIRVVLYAYSQCGNDDGNGALAQHANALAALGIVFVAAHGNAPGTCGGNAIGQRWTKQPGSGSYVLTVSGSDSGTTINRNDDVRIMNHFTGPRSDWNMLAPNPLALKPDLAAPQGMTVRSTATGSQTGIPGTSPATAVTAGAAALLLQRFPTMPPDSVKEALIRAADSSRNTAFSTVTGSWDSALGWGLLNVGQAIRNSLNAAPSPRFENCNTPSQVNAGDLCTTRDGVPTWSNTTDIQATTMPKVGQQTTIRAHVRNGGSSTGTFTVNFGVYIFSAGNLQFHHIGSKQVTLPAGLDEWVEMNWTPAAIDHQCIQVSIAAAVDADYTDNVTQRNFQVLPSQYTMRVENPLFTPARIEIEALTDRAGWQCALSETTFTLDPFKDCARDVTITFDAPANARVGEYANCDVGVYATPIDGKERRLIGGVTARTFVPKSCRAWGQLIDARGAPIAGAIVRATRVHAAESIYVKSYVTSREIEQTAKTNEDGIYEIIVAQDARHRFVVEAPRIGSGEVVTRASCGFGIPRLILTKDGLTTDAVERRAIEHSMGDASHH
jgi:hypothetical protein